MLPPTDKAAGRILVQTYPGENDLCLAELFPAIDYAGPFGGVSEAETMGAGGASPRAGHVTYLR